MQDDESDGDSEEDEDGIRYYYYDEETGEVVEEEEVNGAIRSSGRIEDGNKWTRDDTLSPNTADMMFDFDLDIESEE